jgi:phosphotriesterase-related protein
VHLPSRASAVVSVLDELEAVDAPLGRVSLSHMDTVPDLAVHVEALDRGVWIQYDCFGMALKNDWYEDAGDSRRVEWLIALREQGRLDRVLLSHDVWCKAQLGAYGGEGYSHLLANVAPTLLVRGFDVSDLHQLFVAGPARFLAFTARGELG